KDVMSVIEVTAFGGIWNTLIPALVVLLVLDVAAGAVAVYTLKKATSSGVK
ncbi:MAG: ABC transporter permease, partial [Halobacteria archaeon]|nr:ABC transporter permease [Halobacteria archaeon]